MALGSSKKRCMCMIEPDQLAQMRSLSASSGLSVPEQIRLGIQFWLASREWPVRRSQRVASRAAREKHWREQQSEVML